MTESDTAFRAVRLGAMVLGLICLPGLALGQSTFTHVHLRVPDAWAAAHWYHTLVGGDLRVGGERGMGAARQPNGNIATMYNEPDGSAAPSNVGSVIDHFSVYVDDVDAAVEMARSMGATIDTEPQEGVTVSRIAYIVDPWGTRLEFLEDPDRSGLGHVHLMVNNRDEVRDWFLEIFGGEYDSERGGGRYHAINYGDVWIHISEVEAEEMLQNSRGQARIEARRWIRPDHLLWFGPGGSEIRPRKRLPRDYRLQSVFRRRLVTFSIEATVGYPCGRHRGPYLIRPNPPGSDLLWFEGPGGVHIEISSTAEAPPR